MNADKKANLDSVDASNWQQKDFPIRSGQPNSVPVVIKQSALNDLHEHGHTRTDVEICGVMVGDGYQDARGPFVFVEAVIRGENSESQAAQVTFTAETWNHIQNELDKNHPGKRIVGWYHTHPGFGIFLSSMDLFIHENFFGGDDQLALVYDPLSREEGLFIWRDGTANREPFLVDEDVEQQARQEITDAKSLAMTAAAVEPASAELESRVKRVESGVRWTQLLALGLFLLSLCWTLFLTGVFPLRPPPQNPKPDRRTVPPPPMTEAFRGRESLPEQAVPLQKPDEVISQVEPGESPDQNPKQPETTDDPERSGEPEPVGEPDRNTGPSGEAADAPGTQPAPESNADAVPEAESSTSGEPTVDATEAGDSPAAEEASTEPITPSAEPSEAIESDQPSGASS